MKLEAVNHTKMKRLRRRLQIPKWQAVGLLETIWKLAETEAIAGDIGRLSDEDIALALEYADDEEKLVNALVDAGWIDRHPECRLVIHDWPDHCAEWIHMRLARKRLYFACGKAPKLTNLPHREKETAIVFYSTQGNHVDVATKPQSVATNIDSVATKRQSVAPTQPNPHPTQPIPMKSSGTTHTQATAKTNGNSKVSVCVSSARFADWWELWSAVKGTNHRMKAEEAFPRLVTVELESACFECTASYLRSLSDPTRGYHPENFLSEQAKERFEARWPASTNGAKPPKESLADRTIRMMNERIARGEKPL